MTGQDQVMVKIYHTLVNDTLSNTFIDLPAADQVSRADTVAHQTSNHIFNLKAKQKNLN